MRLTVGHDATLLGERTTGIALVARELGRALEDQGVRVVRYGAARLGDHPRGRQSKTRWALAALGPALEATRPDLFHAFGNFNLPLRKVPGVPLVLTVHDVIPLDQPDTVSAAFRWQFRLWLARSLQVADRVLCVSEATQAALLRRFEVPREKLRVVHNGVDHVDRVPPADPTTRAWIDALALRRHVVLYAGALDARKNVGLAVAACARLHGRGVPVSLLLVGQRWFGSQGVEAQVRDAREGGLDVRLLGFLEDPVFYALMQRSDVFVFPSRDEGFGLPPLEAMRLGTATVVSGRGALPEVCGDGALQVDPDDPAALARTLEGLLASREQRRILAERGKLRAAAFTWARAAQATLAVYRELRSGP